MRACALLLTLLFAGNARAETIVVNLTSDEPDADPNDGTADTDVATDGLQVTLRSAIEHANAHAGPDDILFSEDLGDQPVVDATALPPITEAVTVDGSVQGSRAQVDASLVIRAPQVSLANMVLANGEADALLVENGGGVTLSSVDLVGAAGWGVRSAGDLDFDACRISTNQAGGILALGAVDGESLVVESNGGPGVVARQSIRMTSSQVRSNGGPGLYTPGPVALEGENAISGNIGYGVWTAADVASRGVLEIQDNASWGVFAAAEVVLEGEAVISNDGHGRMMVVPEEITMDPVLTTVTGDDVRGGGVVSLIGGITGGAVTANDNAGPALLAEGGVALGRVTLLRNDGPGLQTLGDAAFDGGRVADNFGIGIAAAGAVTSRQTVRLERNASAAVVGTAVSLGVPDGERSTVAENGRGERATVAMLGDSPVLTATEPRTTAIVATQLVGIAIDVAMNGGDGIDAADVSLTDAAVTDNFGAGLRASGKVTLVRTLLCDNAKGDLIAGEDVTLTESAACDQRRTRTRDTGGCGCSAAEEVPSHWTLLLPLLWLLRRD